RQLHQMRLALERPGSRHLPFRRPPLTFLIFFAIGPERRRPFRIMQCGLREGFVVKKLHEYREHAAECREMARTASPAHRQQLEQMAATWDQLAAARQRTLHRAGQTTTWAGDETKSGG